MDDLTPAEADELARIHREWGEARAIKEFAKSDELRARLIDAGVCNLSGGLWHPVFESSGHRAKRLAARK